MLAKSMNRFASVLDTQLLRGAIFDLDGTLVDSMPLHFDAWQQALAQAGAKSEQIFDHQRFTELGGVSAQDIVAMLNQQYGLSMDAAKVAFNKREIYLQLVQSRGLQAFPEVVEFVRSHRKQFGMAIATGSAQPGALATLKAAGLQDLFDFVITPSDVPHGKPAPDMFLLAARKLNVAAAACVVFEDAPAGIQAAKAAGMHWIEVDSAGLPGRNSWHSA